MPTARPGSTACWGRLPPPCASWPRSPASPRSWSTTCGTSRPTSWARPACLALFTIGETPFSPAQREAVLELVARRPARRARRALGHRRLPHLARVRLADRGTLRRSPLDPVVRHRRGRPRSSGHGAPRRIVASGTTRSTSSAPCAPTPGCCSAWPRTRSTSRCPGGRVPDCGFPLAWCLAEEKGRTFYSALGHFPGAWETPGLPAPSGRRARLAAGGAPNVRRPVPRPATSGPLPDVMPAAVYQSPGVITVEERPVPRPGPGPGARAGPPLRNLRLRHPPAARRLGLQARARWPATSGPAPSRPWATTSTAGRSASGWSAARRPSAGSAGAAGRASPRSARTAAA